MNKNLEARLRLKVRKLVESVLDEESPMEKPDTFKPKTVVQRKLVTIGGLDIYIQGNQVQINTTDNENKILLKKKDAYKLAEYLIRVIGKA